MGVTGGGLSEFFSSHPLIRLVALAASGALEGSKTVLRNCMKDVADKEKISFVFAAQSFWAPTI